MSHYPDDPIEPKRLPKRKYLTQDELRFVLDTAKTHRLRDHAIIRTMYELALRAHEPGRIRLAWCRQLHKGQIYVVRGKGSLQGWHDLTDGTRDLLLKYINSSTHPGDRSPEDWLFPGKRYKGGPKSGIGARAVQYIFKQIARESGLPEEVTNCHVLKHSRVQHLLEAADRAGYSPEKMILVIAKLVGHRSAQTTLMHYSQATAKERELAQRFTKEI